MSHGQDDETEIGSDDKELSPICQVTLECSGQQAVAMRGTKVAAASRRQMMTGPGNRQSSRTKASEPVKLQAWLYTGQRGR